MPIRTQPRPFHTVGIDFILGLPTIPAVNPWRLDHNPQEFDCMMTVTCKFSKRPLLIPGHTTYTADEWAEVFLRSLQMAEWGIPQGIISDRDRKFVAHFWRSIFTRLGTKLLMSTAWHPQTDGLSENRNYQVEVAIRYDTFENPDRPWSEIILPLQNAFSNAYSSAIRTSPNELVYGFKPNTVTTLVQQFVPQNTEHLTAEEQEQLSGVPNQAAEKILTQRRLLQTDAQTAIDFAANTAKEYYDQRHRPITMDVGDMACIKLHKGYNLPGHPNHKLTEQRTTPLRIKRRVGRLAYELELPPNWKIHPVISVTHLEPAPKVLDPFRRPRSDGQEPVDNVEGDTDEWKSYELERIVDHRFYGRHRKLEYLVKFKGWSNAHNDWYPEELLANAQELVDEYRARIDLTLPSRRTSRQAQSLPQQPQEQEQQPQEPQPQEPRRSTRSARRGHSSNN
jgi:hypothetical protein